VANQHPDGIIIVILNSRFFLETVILIPSLFSYENMNQNSQTELKSVQWWDLEWRCEA
jgi:hypothetical protein